MELVKTYSGFNSLEKREKGGGGRRKKMEAELPGPSAPPAGHPGHGLRGRGGNSEEMSKHLLD